MDRKKGEGKFNKREPAEFEQKIIDLARVTRVMAGGKRMRFRAFLAIGDKKGRVGVGLAKGADVSLAVNKAFNKAKKNLVTISLINETIPHAVWMKHKAALIMIKPAPKGTGIKAGGSMRVLLELAGVPNIVGKIVRNGNKINNVNALINAIKVLKKPRITAKKPEVKPVIVTKPAVEKVEPIESVVKSPKKTKKVVKESK